METSDENDNTKDKLGWVWGLPAVVFVLLLCTPFARLESSGTHRRLFAEETPSTSDDSIKMHFLSSISSAVSRWNETIDRRCWVETDPSIARLPESYTSQRTEWLELFGTIPYYVVSYRVTNDCYRSNNNKNNNNDNFLGVALLDRNLDILVDTTVTLQEMDHLFPLGGNNFRLFHRNGALYLKTFRFVAPIHLSLRMPPDTLIQTFPLQKDGFEEIPPALLPPLPSSCLGLVVLVRNYVSCIDQEETMVPFAFDDASVENLDQPCNRTTEIVQQYERNLAAVNDTQSVVGVESSSSSSSSNDSNVVRCFSIQEDRFATKSLRTAATTETKELVVAIVDNARFVAFSPDGVIVAQSEAVCLENRFAARSDGCKNNNRPFVNGVVEKVPLSNEKESTTIVVSYGIQGSSSSLSRFVEIRKSEILAMMTTTIR